MSTAHHPQSDGQTERLNRCLETYLRCMSHSHPRKWNQWLHLAEWWYNTCHHHSIKQTPFKALHGYDAPQLSTGPYLDSTNSLAARNVQERQQMLQDLKEHMTQAQERMKKYADSKRSERTFEVGDWVFLKIQPFKQGNTLLRRPTKFSIKYFGPFQVLARLEMWLISCSCLQTQECMMFSIYHYLREKKKYHANTTVPEVDQNGYPRVYPQAVLGTRMVQARKNVEKEVLIQWSNLSPEEATWERANVMKVQYPEFKLP
ncbi:unnamed protein product [Cuscuta europaea]|uniref:Integrase catalytic domain-containing protein n=1 Tax=Cuscuta europaea TaxID=41803 RepID=A0A9P0Z499_CUSEU|nr:unnamed protein product [Cuscuta europaea]